MVSALEGPHGRVMQVSNRTARRARVSACGGVVDMRALCPRLKVEHPDPRGNQAAVESPDIGAGRVYTCTVPDPSHGVVYSTGPKGKAGQSNTPSDDLAGVLAGVKVTSSTARLPRPEDHILTVFGNEPTRGVSAGLPLWRGGTPSHRPSPPIMEGRATTGRQITPVRLPQVWLARWRKLAAWQGKVLQSAPPPDTSPPDNMNLVLCTNPATRLAGAFRHDITSPRLEPERHHAPVPLAGAAAVTPQTPRIMKGAP